MHVKDGKAFASLTEVKNKLGDVFALADEHGEVYVSSYNKPKYIISRIHTSKRDLADAAELVKKMVVTKKELKIKKSSADPTLKPAHQAKDWSRETSAEHTWARNLRS